MQSTTLKDLSGEMHAHIFTYGETSFRSVYTRKYTLPITALFGSWLVQVPVVGENQLLLRTVIWPCLWFDLCFCEYTMKQTLSRHANTIECLPSTRCEKCWYHINSLAFTPQEDLLGKIGGSYFVGMRATDRIFAWSDRRWWRFVRCSPRVLVFRWEHAKRYVVYIYSHSSLVRSVSMKQD